MQGGPENQNKLTNIYSTTFHSFMLKHISACFSISCLYWHTDGICESHRWM